MKYLIIGTVLWFCSLSFAKEPHKVELRTPFSNPSSFLEAVALGEAYRNENQKEGDKFGVVPPGERFSLRVPKAPSDTLPKLSFDTGPVLAFSPDGSVVAVQPTKRGRFDFVSSDPDKTLEVYEVKTGKKLINAVQASFVRKAYFSPDSTLLVLQTERESLVYQVDNGEELHRHYAQYGFHFSPDSKFMANSSDILDAKTGKSVLPADVFARGARFTSFDFTANSLYALAWKSRETVLVVDLTTTKIVAEITSPIVGIHQISSTPDAEYLVITTRDGGDKYGMLRILSLDSGEIVKAWREMPSNDKAGFSSSGRTLNLYREASYRAIDWADLKKEFK